MTLPGFTAEDSLGKQTKAYRSHAGLSPVSALGYGMPSNVVPAQVETYYEDNGESFEEYEEEYEGEMLYEAENNEEVEEAI